LDLAKRNQGPWPGWRRHPFEQRKHEQLRRRNRRPSVQPTAQRPRRRTQWNGDWNGHWHRNWFRNGNGFQGNDGLWLDQRLGNFRLHGRLDRVGYDRVRNVRIGNDWIGNYRFRRHLWKRFDRRQRVDIGQWLDQRQWINWQRRFGVDWRQRRKRLLRRFERQRQLVAFV